MQILEYNPAMIEPKWQQYWEEAGVFHALEDHTLPKYYCLIEFPYPSGEGLHMGHPRPYTAMDIIARKRRMEGYNVLLPIGWDAFGLPAENNAIKNHVHPRVITEENIARFRGQTKRLGFSVDWNREVDTTDPAYYRWTQWIFLQLFKKGMAYKAEMPINWCTSCKCGLANEEVVDGVCERCGSEVVRKVKNQWMLRITAYAQKLLDGLDTVDFIERAKAQQRNWIGRSTGAEVDFAIADSGETLRVFTTRPDTLFGATYMVISPEHPLVERMRDRISNCDALVAYREAASRKSDFERTELAKDKTGVAIQGVTAINPVTGKPIPIWVSDYVLMSYGTGAIMAVPGHDTRDWAFARKFGLPVVEVVAGGDIETEAYTDIESGVMVNSGFLNGLSVEKAKRKITQWLKERGLGEETVKFKLRDWVFSRQRYWGEPIPLVHCERCGWVPLPENELPLLLPQVEKYETTQDGESPLAAMGEWVNTVCPHCGSPAKRETDTMPQWAGSSWYFLRYMDPRNDQALASPEALAYWGPVDWYNGGMEHTTLHLLYSRFWHRFLYDIGVVGYPEPYLKRTSHGFVLGENGEKMSKSRGNVINPDEVIRDIGADALRVYEMFMGAFDQAIPWSANGAAGCRRFLERVWRMQEMLADSDEIREEVRADVHACVKKVSEDIERMKFNTAIAAMMTLVNTFYASGRVTRGEMKVLVLLLSPVAPHIAEEIWQRLGGKESLACRPWPKWDEEAMRKDEIEIAIQIGGKVRGRMMAPTSLTAGEGGQVLMEAPEVRALLDGRPVRKVIYVPGRLLNIVV
ncbi:MAG: leucine--tRNA ligase [Firmicutes bacterium]|nr:leucine--tRNA ligase [Bacillota bacterium]